MLEPKQKHGGAGATLSQDELIKYHTSATSFTDFGGFDDIATPDSPHPLVVDEGSPIEPEGEGGDSDAQRTCCLRNYKILVVSCILLAALAVACPLFLLQLPTSKNESPSDGGMFPGEPVGGPSSEEDEARQEELHQFVRSQLPNTTIQALIDPFSPQAQAYEWTIRHPQLQDLPDWKIKQKFALTTFYYAFRGPSWSDNVQWMSYYKDECQWDAYYVACPDLNQTSPGQGRIEVLAPTRRRFLQGIIPQEVALLLPELKVLDFSLNTFKTLEEMIQHPLPASLQEFKCEYCDLKGGIPSESIVAAADNLKDLDLSNNNIEGTIPSALGLLSRLTNLDLGANSLSGRIPSELALLDSLSTLNLLQNPNLEIYIPLEFCQEDRTVIDLRTDWCEGDDCCRL